MQGRPPQSLLQCSHRGAELHERNLPERINLRACNFPAVVRVPRNQCNQPPDRTTNAATAPTKPVAEQSKQWNRAPCVAHDVHHKCRRSLPQIHHVRLLAGARRDNDGGRRRHMQCSPVAAGTSRSQRTPRDAPRRHPAIAGPRRNKKKNLGYGQWMLPVPKYNLALDT